MVLRGWNLAEEAKNLPPGWTMIRPPGEVACLLPDGETVWAGGRDGLCCVDRKTAKVLPPTVGQPRFGYVHAIRKSSSGALWVAHDGGVALLQSGKWSPQSDGPRRAFSLCELPDGQMLVGIEGGLARWRNGHWTTEKLEGGTGPIGEIDSLLRDRTGRLWAGSSSPSHGGLRVLENGRWRAFGPDLGLPHPSVNALLEDREGTLWVGTGFASHGGAARLVPGAAHFAAFPLDAPHLGVKVRSLYQDTHERIWIGLEYDGALVRDGSSWKWIPPRQGIAGQEVKVVRQDADATFWLGTNSGLSRFDESASVPDNSLSPIP